MSMSSSSDLMLNPSCGRCGMSSDLYGSSCKHMTLCLPCGKSMALSQSKCFDCGIPITRLIREYNVRAGGTNDKTFYIGRFATGLPNFSQKKGLENKWTMHRDGLQGRQVTDALREKYRNKPWLLEDETGHYQYQGQIEGSQSANYYLLMTQGKEFLAFPAGSWYNFSKVAQYKQLTLEEAEEKMRNRRKSAEGYQRWMMKAANNGAAAFGEVEKEEGRGGVEGSRRRKGIAEDEEETALSDKGEEDEEEELARKNRLGLNRKGADDDEEGPRGGDLDFDDDDVEKGDDWEHEEIFTDDDEAVGNDPEERDDLAPEIPAPPEIKQDDDDDEEGDEAEGKLSSSGKELKKLLGRAAGLNDSDAEDDEDDDDMDDDVANADTSPVLAPKKKDALKEEPVDSSPSKPPSASASRGTPSQAKSSKAKRKPGADEKTPNTAPTKKTKTDHDSKSSSVKEEPAPSSKGQASSTKSGSAASSAPVSEDEIRAALLQMAPITTQELVAKFKARLKSKEDRNAFAEILKRISKIHKSNGHSYVIIKDR